MVVSKRLTKSPAALVAGTYGLTANMERIVRSQVRAPQRAVAWPTTLRVAGAGRR